MRFVVSRAELIDSLTGLFRFCRQTGSVDVTVGDGVVKLITENRRVTFPVTVLAPGSLSLKAARLRVLRAKVRKFTEENVMVTIANARPEVSREFAMEVQFCLEAAKDTEAPGDVYASIGSHIRGDG